MNPDSLLRPSYIAYFRDFSGLRSPFWIAALVLSVLFHAYVVWQASHYTPPPPAAEELRVDVRMIEPLPPPPPPPPPPVVVVPPPPPPPPPKPVPKPPKELPRQAPLPVLAAPPAPAAPAEPVVPVQPEPAPLPPIDAPPPPPAPPAPPVAARPAPVAPVENVDALIDGFGRDLSRAFEANKVYPRVAQMRNIQGKLKLKFVFANGEMTDVTVAESSGQKLLDDAAIAVARKLSIPALLGRLTRESFSIVLPVDYALK